MTTSLTELREAVDSMKAESGSGSKQRKQNTFRDHYSVPAVKILTGEEWDAAGIGPTKARSCVESVYSVDDAPTLSESLITVDGGDNDDLFDLVESLDELAELSGNEQEEHLKDMLRHFTEPSLITLALLQDESFGLGTSQMREAYFDGTRAERKRAEALTTDTVDFIIRARNDTLPDGPEPFTPFDPMLAKQEKHMPDDLSGWVGQLKLDGYRILLHISDGNAVAYTRRRKNVTPSLPELVDIDWPEGDYIFDGEVIAETGSYNDTSSRVGAKPENLDLSTGMEFALFDVVYANRDMTEEPYESRHNMLERLSAGIDDERVYALDASTDISKVKQYAMEEGYEGILVKQADAEYELATRSSAWVKAKHQEERVDVRISDVLEGEGRLSGTMGKLKVESAEGTPLGSVGTGFSDADRDRIWRNQQEWVGGTIEVGAEAFKDGLRFPVFERDRRADGEPDDLDKIKSLLEEA